MHSDSRSKILRGTCVVACPFLGSANAPNRDGDLDVVKRTPIDMQKPSSIDVSCYFISISKASLGCCIDSLFAG
ncbi:uncharacterized protein PHALS_14990 [Plasmopara halstedii]|uniref:Uncharacterized protein n=1 Tax=Plasmopara halstedii TaxID=4781 RepID=A0A0P1A911_PLAHL|nr:uncharacterized protein PHALS_14990 [Plasmopara halstedii]CEG36852.1 hypothetical protein PHALS_14990 [Plasmopara halstedii]|eukprot:XP_024573221.1 hypothetical protein PHALS_14990 [Plasmopara halstedii]